MKKLSHLLLLSFLAFGMAATTSCSEDKEGGVIEKVEYPNVTLNAGSTQALAKGKDMEWKSSNNLIASVEDGVVIGKIIGKAKMTCANGGFTVTVTSKYNGYTEPYIDFGASRAAVKEYMKKTEQLIRDVDTLLIYKGTNGNTDYVIYHFDDKTNGLDGSYFATTPSHKSELENWAMERYLSVASLDNNSFSMVSLDMKTNIRVKATKIFNEDYLLVGYTKTY